MNIVADIGGTNARIACFKPDPTEQSAGTLSHLKRYICADFPSMTDAIKRYCEDHQITPVNMSLAVAGPVDGPNVQFTNNPWFFAEDIKTTFNLSSLTVVNDFTAQALVPPYLTKTEMTSIREGRPVPNTPILVLGAGTGLGFLR